MKKQDIDFTEKISIIQTELNSPKGKFNSFGKYKYRSSEDILNSVKPFLKDLKLSLIVRDSLEMIGDRYYVKAEAVIKDGLGNSESSTSYAREPQTRKGMDDAQVTGSTSSYARKYALAGLLCLDDEDDPDKTNKHEDSKNSKTFVGVDEIVASCLNLDGPATDQPSEKQLFVLRRLYGQNKLTENERRSLEEKKMDNHAAGLVINKYSTGGKKK